MSDFEKDFEEHFEEQIRPKEFTQFSGQEKITDNLKIFVKAALLRGESLDHVLLHGPPGLGKNHVGAHCSQRTKCKYADHIRSCIG